MNDPEVRQLKIFNIINKSFTRKKKPEVCTCKKF